MWLPKICLCVWGAALATAQTPPAMLTIEQLRAGADAYWGSIRTVSATSIACPPLAS